MTYIIHNRFVWIIWDKYDFRDEWRMFFPSWRKEHREPVTVIRL